MIILAFDQSITRTGWCVYNAPGTEKAMVCGSFSCSDERTDDAKCHRFGRRSKLLVGRWKPDFVGWEQAKKQISAYPKKDDAALLSGEASAPAAPRFTVSAKQLLLPRIEGQLQQLCIDYSLPYESVGVRTWRADIFGTGGGSLHRDAAKATAKIYCRRLGIKFENEDEAEAACIARWMATCSQKFRLLVYERSKAVAA